ncbi:hypothetical protein V8C44DRAFT_216802 [Trichoderma aethiopicum]
MLPATMFEQRILACSEGLFTTLSTSMFRKAVLHCQRVNAGPPGCRNKGQAACGRFRTTQGKASGRQCHSTHAHADRGSKAEQFGGAEGTGDGPERHQFVSM